MTELQPIIVLSVGIILYLIWKRVNTSLFDDFFSPFNLLFYFWMIPLLIRGLNLSYFERDWNLTTIIAVSMVTISMVSVSLLFPLQKNKKIRSFSDGRLAFLGIQRALQDNRLVAFLLLLFIPIFLLYIYTEFLTNPGGIALISGLAGTLSTENASFYGWGKTQGRTFWTSLSTTITQLLLVLGPAFYLKSKCSKRIATKAIFLAIALLTTIFGFLKLSKMDVITPIFGLALTEYYYRKYTSDRHIGNVFSMKTRVIAAIGLAGLMVAIFWSTAVFRIGGYGGVEKGAYFIYVTRFKFSEPTMLNTIASLIYAYTALNFENVNRFINSYDGGLNIGISAFRPFLSILGQGKIAQEMMSRIDFNYVSPPTIAMTFINLIYAEAGWFGLLFIPIFYACFVNFLYHRLRANPGFTNLFLYLNYAFCWSFLFFTNPFGTLIFHVNAAFILFLGGQFARMGNQRIRSRSRLGKTLPFSTHKLSENQTSNEEIGGACE